ncbi:helix-turn-helix transcriptional regulator [Priestia aryabhattai]|uniref:helix-turn-helix domain-containing protein n=1 Tax=Priestia aryabhattai TaxID=412384 RepID=UPI0025A33F1B|nr:helix-turn-helix transcriptional regulator [Priestia aryabhattai]WJN45969.1 helix-turn-helix transcriptional regulator [Priestia aryabhattai]
MIGDRIKDMRLQKRYSITRLAEKAQISKSYLSQIEKGSNSNPSLQMLHKIAASLGTSVDYLIDETNEHTEADHHISEEWLELLGRAIDQGMTQEDFIEFYQYLSFKKNLQTVKNSKH